MEERIDEAAIENDGNSFSLKKASRVGGPVTCVAFSPLDPEKERDFLVAQGPYLTRYTDRAKNSDGNCDKVHGDCDGADDNDCHVRTRGRQQEQQLLVFPEDEKRPRGGGTIHGIHFLDQERNLFTSLDAVVYGGKRLAFCNLLGDAIVRRNVMEVLEEDAKTTAPNTTRRIETIHSSQPFLELGDWIWNVKMFSKKSYDNHDKGSDNDSSPEMTMVVGYARHMIEVWDVKETINGTEEVVCVTKLRRLFLNPPTVVTSMDFVFLNKQYQRGEETCSKGDSNEIDTLWIAAGTSFHEIWISCIYMKEILRGETKDEEIQLDLLKGHSGVVHSVRWFQDGDRISLASTSDDRSVRKWVWDTARKEWVEKWVGWGHSARVWSVSPVYSEVLASKSSESSMSPSLPLLVSVAEDGTARVWSSESGEILACIHHSATLRTIDTKDTTDGGMFIIGGTDGVSAIYNVCNHVAGKNMIMNDDIAVPDDRPPAIIDESTSCSNSSKETGKNHDSDVGLTKKKKKAKKKTQSQVLVGVKCWQDGSTSGSQKVIVSTRQGSLMSYGVEERKWETGDTWWEPSLKEKFGIQANDGNCMAVHNGISTVAIGTSRGNIVLSSFHQGRKSNSAILNAHKLRSVQGLAFLDSFCLVSFHVHSVALWKMEFDVFPTAEVLEPDCVLDVETKGIPQSCAYDQVNQRVVVGDSRGNLAYFQVKNFDLSQGREDHHISQTSVIHKVHQKQHITSVKWLNQSTILSAGNDGCVHISYLHGDSLQKGWSYPAPSLTGVTRIIRSLSPTIVAGYHGNTYRVLDIDSGYEYIHSDTGGRQRILDCSFNLESNGEDTAHNYQLVVCKAQKDGTNNLFVQSSEQQSPHTILKESSHVAKGVKLHGETIFDSVFFTLSNQDIVFLVTASEDCSSRISAWKDGVVVDSISLTPQESCCRCVTVSQIDEKSALLVVGGGKLALQFFLIKESSNCTKTHSTKDLEITVIGDGLTSKKGSTIDHRINSVEAVPFLNSDCRSHFVIAGDSEGASHAFIISEDKPQNYRNPCGLLVPTSNQRPILCIKALAIGNRFLVLMGTTGGNVDIFDLPSSLSQLQDCWGGNSDFSSLWNPITSYHAHQMGTNTISTEILSMDEMNGAIHAVISIVSGGDDQALCISQVSLEQVDNSDPHLQLQKVPHLKVIPEASFSAIKGVSHLRFRDQRYLLSVGYSQQLSIWKFCEDETLLECKSRLPVDLGDINCLSAYQTTDESDYLVAVCGMGVEIFRQGSQITFDEEQI